MVRAFAARPVAAADVDALIDLARHAPAAGNTDGRDFLVLDTPEAVAAYWDTTLPADRRGSFRWPGLLAAPVLVAVLVRPDSWVERYAEPDKARTGLGHDGDAWPVPYWWVDGGMAAMTILHGAVDVDLGALFFGTFEHEGAVRARFGVPDDRRIVGVIALGHPVPHEAGRSAARHRRPVDEVIHRNAW
jgi:nitroreductase